jgi:hypothetical protein
MATNFWTVSGTSAVSQKPTAWDVEEKAQEGAWRGQKLALARAGTTRAALQQLQDGARTFPTLPARELASRHVAAENSFRSMPAPALFQRAETLGLDLRRVRAGARDLLSGNPAAAATGRRASAALRYLQLHLAASSVEDDVKEDAATAMLTPVRGREHTAEDLSRFLRQSSGDNEEFKEFLEGILAGLDITAEDAEEYADELRRARHDDAKLMELLRKLQRIPQLYRDQDRAERLRVRSRIQNEIREFESSSEGKQVLAQFNAAPVAAGTADPVTFLQTYMDLVSVPRSFAAALKLLLSRYALDQLEGMLDQLKKALGDDLAAATPSQDLRRLGAVLTDLSHMAISSSLIDSIRELMALIERVEERKEHEKRRRGREDAEEDEEGEEEENAENQEGSGHGPRG